MVPLQLKTLQQIINCEKRENQGTTQRACVHNHEDAKDMRKHEACECKQNRNWYGIEPPEPATFNELYEPEPLRTGTAENRNRCEPISWTNGSEIFKCNLMVFKYI